ncbi:hypothetical protein SB6409_02985 [Klebsiella pasteurii]|uniref:Uncharacterized protein n=1 Tax=Klebsiella pasteurii TaxID=2587529 RepID=A0A9Q9S9B6_9ENTR|nr:hypothetical protein SB6410_02423 [Klebsiella pasteurii]VUT11552.1 hypothetical protein SB6409_02985 [Klebsiella pasteurii]
MSDSIYRTKRIIASNECFLLIHYILLFLTNYFFYLVVFNLSIYIRRFTLLSKAEITSALHSI